MAKFYGEVGYGVTEETTPGNWTPTIKKVNYYGDVTRVSLKNQSGEKLNDDINVNNKISIMADAFALDNFMDIEYVEWKNNKWKVPSAEVAYPRIILTIGGVYNG